MDVYLQKQSPMYSCTYGALRRKLKVFSSSVLAVLSSRFGTLHYTKASLSEILIGVVRDRFESLELLDLPETFEDP